MPKSTHIALMASLLLGTTVLGACSKDAPAPTNEPASETVKTAPKPEVKVELPKTAEIVTPEMAGKKVFTRCKACHTIDQGGRHRVGPNLYGIFGQKAGAAEGFAYSQAMINSDIVWTDETMSGYLAKPKTYIPKNKMSFIGLKKEADRDNLIAYLRANTGG